MVLFVQRYFLSSLLLLLYEVISEYFQELNTNETSSLPNVTMNGSIDQQQAPQGKVIAKARPTSIQQASISDWKTILVILKIVPGFRFHLS